ncbi:MAG TPA: universal stress protein [Candidatus Binataceae bacterium]|jgi:nucleotide-binding universal stress UspA family protein|nr:universal stress protein [Candidatus Binataceae bacterium]
MIKKILVGIDTSEHSRNAQAYAFYIARKLDATVMGLHVVDIVSIEGSFFHDISGSLGLEPYLDFSSKMRDVLTQRGKTVLEEFTEAARRENIPVETALDMGIVANQICERAKSADLVLIGHRGINERFSTGLLGSTAESVARKCPRPLFISPMRFREIKRPVLAYDGSERASRAMRAAADFAAGFSVPLTVVTVARDPKLGERTLEEARKYFERFTPAVEFKLLSGHANEEIIRFIKEHDADCLFIGAYGHSRIIEMVLGSTTEYVLRNAPCPVFLSR